MKVVSDREVLEEAVDSERVLLTIDKDFISGIQDEYDHYGVVKFRKRYSIGDMIKDVQKINSTLSKDELRNSEVFLPWDP